MICRIYRRRRFILNQYAKRYKRNSFYWIKITLHIDDIKVLNLIKDKLEFGNVTISKSSSSYKVHSFKDIQKLLLIFNKYPLLTHKQIDYDIWRQAIEIKQSHLETKSLKISKNKSFDEDTYNKLLLLKTSLNKSKLDSSLKNYIIHKNSLLNRILD